MFFSSLTKPSINRPPPPPPWPSPPVYALHRTQKRCRSCRHLCRSLWATISGAMLLSNNSQLHMSPSQWITSVRLITVPLWMEGGALASFYKIHHFEHHKSVAIEHHCITIILRKTQTGSFSIEINQTKYIQYFKCSELPLRSHDSDDHRTSWIMGFLCRRISFSFITTATLCLLASVIVVIPVRMGGGADATQRATCHSKCPRPL